MGEQSASSDGSVRAQRFFMHALAVSNFAAGALPLLVMLLLIDIGSTFNTEVGVTGQTNTLYSVAAVVFALLMGAFSIRFRHKSLLLIGLLFINISAVGCFLAQDFPQMVAGYALSGIGFAMISPMSIALIGEHFAIEKRAKAVGWIIAGGALVYFVGAPLIAYAASFGSWRFAILVFVMPISLASLLLAWGGLHSVGKNSNPSAANSRTYLRSFGEVLSNRSALACLVGDFFRSGSFVAIVIFAASFGRQRFSQSRELASIVILTGALCYTIGSLICGAMVNKFGRKNLTVLGAFVSGAFVVLYVSIPSELLYVVSVFVASLFFGITTSSANSLSLEQVPKLRGTMMSIDSAAVNLGSAFGTAVGGAALVSFNYEGLGLALGAMGIIAALVFRLFTRDPTKQ